METQRGSPSFSDATESASPRPASLPELRLVLLGRKGAGKSSAGNTILSLPGGFDTGKPTEECVKRRAEVSGRRLTVVDTPGWEWYYPVNGTPGWVRRETMRSMSLCPPGPHAVLLVVRSCTSVTAEYHRQIEEYLELLGKNVWDHTLVLFTRGDELGSISIEERIKNGGKDFQSLLQRCGNRFHVLENKRRADNGTQVKELMRKMDKLVEGKGGKYYEIDFLHLELEADGKRRARERRKKQRLMEAQTQRGSIRSVLMNENHQVEDLDEKSLFSRSSRRLPELRLVLMGERETGKSSAGNAILGGTRYFKSGEATEECSRQQAEVSNRLLTVVDVPGWEGGPEGTTPERVKREIGLSVTLCPPGPHAFLLTLRVDALVQAPAVREHLELLGETVWRHSLLLFTRGDQLRQGVTIEQHIQGGGKDLHWLMEKCSNRFHVISSNSCLNVRNSSEQITVLLEKIEKMVAGNRCEAFSPLVHEIQELGRQKNEKFQLKVKEFNEKIQRQEVELRKMKEREVKSIRWFFERRKKDKVPFSGNTEREEVPYRGEDDRRSMMGELEERMAWLTDDREREIQEMTTEMSQVITSLRKEQREKERMEMRLEEQDREREELKEKVEELQIKLLELEHICVMKDQERKERDTEFQLVHQNELNEMRHKMKAEENEHEAMKKNIEKMEEDARQKLQEMESKLKQKDKKIESIFTEKLEAESRAKEQCERLREISENNVKEIDKLREVIEMMTNKMNQLQTSYQEQVKLTEAEKETHANFIEEYNMLRNKLVGKEKEIAVLRREKEQTKKEKEEGLRQNDAKQEKLQQNQEEINKLQQKLMENDDKINAKGKSIDEKEKENDKLKDIIQINNQESAFKLKHLHKELRAKDDEICKFKQIDIEMDKKIDILQRTMQSETEKFTDIIQMNSQEITTLRQTDTEKNREIDKLRESIDNKQGEIEKLENIMQINIKESAFKLKHLHEELREKDDEIHKLKLSNMENEKEMAKKQRDVERLEDTAQANLKESESKLEHLHDKLKVKYDEIDKLKQKNMENETKIDIFRENINNKQEEIEKLKDIIEESTAQLKHLHEELNVKDDEIYKLKQRDTKKQMDILRQNANEKQDAIDQLTEFLQTNAEKHAAQLKHLEEEFQVKIQDQRRKNKVIKDEVERITRKYEEKIRQTEYEIRKKEKIIYEVEQKHTDLERSSEELRLQNKNDREINILLQNSNTQLDKKIQELMCKCERLEKIQRETEDEIKELQSRYEKKKEKDARSLEQIKEQEHKINELKQLLEGKEQEMKDIKVSYESEHIKREQQLQRREKEVNKTEEKLSERLKELEQQEQELGKTQENIYKREKELTEEWNNLEKKIENECEKHKHITKDLEEMKEELDKRQQEITNIENSFKDKEKEINQKKEELEKAWEKVIVKQKEMKDVNEKGEKHLENLKQQLQTRERDLLDIEERLVKERQTLEEEDKVLGLLRVSLETRENELNKRETQITDAKQMWEEKIQELENNKHEVEKLQAELSNKEHELQENKTLTEQDLVLLKSINDEWGSKEQELKKREEALCQREHKLKSEVIYLEKRQKVLQNREERYENTLHGLKKQRDVLKEKERWLDGKETQLHHLEAELNKRRDDITQKERFLQSRESEAQKQENDVISKTQTLKQNEKYFEESRNQLECKARDLSRAGEDMQIKQDELEKWEKYLYNAELNLIHEQPFSEYKRWINSAEFIGKPEEAEAVRDENNLRRSEEQIYLNSKVKHAKNMLTKTWNGNGMLKDKQQDISEKESSDEDFFESSSILQSSHMSELRLMLLTDTWSSRHTARYTLLGPDAGGENPWTGEIYGRRLKIVTPPGLKWRSGANTKVTLEKHLSQSLSLCHPGPHAFLLLIPAYVSFTSQYRCAVEQTMSVLGDEAWGRTIVLLTWGETLGESDHQHVKRYGDLEWLVRKCGNRCHVIDNRHRETHVVKLLEKIDHMSTGK